MHDFLFPWNIKWCDLLRHFPKWKRQKKRVVSPQKSDKIILGLNCIEEADIKQPSGVKRIIFLKAEISVNNTGKSKQETTTHMASQRAGTKQEVESRGDKVIFIVIWTPSSSFTESPLRFVTSFSQSFLVVQSGQIWTNEQ